MFATSPLERLERGLSPWVAYVIVPTFALANAGVALTSDAVGGIVSNRITVGVILGLVVGKTVGILAASAIAVRLGIGRLPAGATWRHMLGLSTVAGVGFTVALFVTSLSFDAPGAGDAAKIGILVGSAVAGVLGYTCLRTTSGSAPARPGHEPQDEGADDGSAEHAGHTELRRVPQRTLVGRREGQLGDEERDGETGPGHHRHAEDGGPRGALR